MLRAIRLALPAAFVCCSSQQPGNTTDIVRVFGGLELSGELGIETDEGRVYVCAHSLCENEIVSLKGATRIVSDLYPNAQLSSAGTNQYCAIIADGTIRCATCSSLGVGCTDWVHPIDNSNVVNLAGSCAILNDGTVKCWAGLAPQTTNVKQIACGYVLTQSGELVDQSSSLTVLQGVQSVACGITGLALELPASRPTDATYCAIMATKQLYCWGANIGGRLGDGTFASQSQPTLVGDGFVGVAVQPESEVADSTCGLKTDGSVWCWGSGLSLLNAGKYNVTPFQLALANVRQVVYGPAMEPLDSSDSDGIYYAVKFDGTVVEFAPAAMLASATITAPN